MKTANFSGIWSLNVTRSERLRDIPQALVMRIAHQLDHIVQDVKVKRAAGTEQLKFSYIVGGETTNELGGLPLPTRAHWRADVLVIEGVLKTPSRELHFRDHWSLSPDRMTLKMSHPDDDLAGQISVLERATP